MHHRLSFLVIVCILVLSIFPLHAQSPSATVNGQVTDTSGAIVQGADVQLINDTTNLRYAAKTNRDGIYSLTQIPPGTYHIQVSKTGFKTIVKPDILLNVLDARAINFDLPVGAISETVTVEGGAPLLNTESAAVSTVVDRQFAENLPMNGRSFQTLIQLTPGVVLTPTNPNDGGQFSINGQRATSNYWMVDGVSANIGMSAGGSAGNGLGGALGGTSVLGGTNSLVSVDAMQEFRIETSTFAPEFGRTPGGQISIVTRSGTNQFHGTVFDYLRNDALDANDWFNGVNILNPTPLPKAKERQNDFGGTLSGPIIKNRTFFFFSYEGLRLRLPQTTLTFVPDASFTPGGTTNSRGNASPALQPYFNAFPLPNQNSPEVFVACDPTIDPTCPSSGQKAGGYAAFNASYSNPSTLNAYSLRIDHKINEKLNIFGRYNYSPSKITERGVAGSALSGVSPTSITTETATIGMSWAISNLAANDFRFNYSSTDSSGSNYLDAFGGAVPLTSLPLPSPYTIQNGGFSFNISALGNYYGLVAGGNVENHQRQLNFVDSVSLQRGTHGIKIGVDFRRLSPKLRPSAYDQASNFLDVPSAEAGITEYSVILSSLPTNLLFRNLSVFAQDTWKVRPRLTLTYGFRWDMDFVPKPASGPGFPAVTGFDLANLANLSLAAPGTPPYKTTYGNFAPRVGVAYQLRQKAKWQTVLRGGFGVFYDMATSEAGNILQSFYYPFGSLTFGFGTNFPLSGSDAQPAPIEPPNATNSGFLNAFDPNLKLPYTLQWNFAIEQSLGAAQSLTASYIGSKGKRLLQTASIGQIPPDFLCYPSFCNADLVTNAGTSDYDALQLQFHRQMTRGLQALASYTWSHSIDTGSAGSIGNASNALSVLRSNINRGPSDFDIRNALSFGLTYDVPMNTRNPVENAILRGWSIENVVQAHSAPPVDVNYTGLGLATGFATNTRPDVVPGQPFYLYGATYPGGKAFNAGAFTLPALDPVTGLPITQGDLPRNALRGFGLAQWDFAVHRDFPIRESMKLQFRAEMFNLLNHPNFGPPSGTLASFGIPNPQFGLSSAMFGKSLSGTFIGTGGFDPLYQIGGSRSIQFALKLSF